jgi:hypothetical protein
LKGFSSSIALSRWNVIIRYRLIILSPCDL